MAPEPICHATKKPSLRKHLRTYDRALYVTYTIFKCDNLHKHEYILNHVKVQKSDNTNRNFRISLLNDIRSLFTFFVIMYLYESQRL